MPTITEIRQKYPQYNDLSDTQLADSLHSKFYSDLPKDEFNSKIGLAPQQGYWDKQYDAAKETTGALASSLTKLPTGMLQGTANLMARSADAYGFPETAANYRNTGLEFQKLGAGLEGINNTYTEKHPVAGTFANIIPQVGQVAGFGTSLPGIMAGGATIGALSPQLSEEQAQNLPKGDTKFSRALEPVAKYGAQAEEALGIDPNSREGKAWLQAGLGALTYGAGKPIGMAVSKAGQGVNAAGKGIVRQATKINPEAVAALRESGIEPTLQLAGDSWATRSLANTISKVPVIGERLNDRFSAGLAQLENNVDSAASTLGTARDAIEGGQALQKGLGSFKEKTDTRIDDLYNNRLATALPGDTPANLDATKAFAGQYTGKYAKTPNIANKMLNPDVSGRLGGIVQDANSVDFSTLKNIRTDIGEQAGKVDAPGAYKQMYGALSDDMAATAAATSPDAVKALNVANRYTRLTKGTQDKLKRFFTSHSDGSPRMEPESVFNASRQELALLKRSIPKEDFNNYSAATLRTLGRASSGAQDATGQAFSANKFLTGINDLNKSGKLEIITSGNKQLGVELSRAAKVANRFQELGKASNYSNTTNNLVSLGSMALLWAPKQALKYGGAAYVGSRLLTSPKALRVLNDYAYRPVMKNAKVQSEFSKQLIRAVGEDPELQKEVGIYLNDMKIAPVTPKVTNVLPPINQLIDDGESLHIPTKSQMQQKPSYEQWRANY